MINATLLAVMQWSVVDYIIVLIWFLALVLITVFRGLLFLSYKKACPGFEEADIWGRLFLAGVTIAALAWGATTIWLFSDDVVHQVFIAFVLAGMCAGAVSSMSFMRATITSFLIITLLPLTIQLIRGEELIVNVMGVMVALFFLGLMVTSKNIYSNTEENIILRMESLLKNKILKQAYQDLDSSRQEAEKANKAKSEFMSRMSHELRTPMNAILGFSQLMLLDKENQLAEVHKNNVKEVVVASKHLLYLINEILDLSQIETGDIQISMEDVFLKDAVEVCIEIVRPEARNKQIKLIDQSDDCGYMIKADFSRLKQVLLNLLSNAVKFNREQGVITIGCKAVDNQRLRVSVTDTGIGLTEKELNKLFVPFGRLDGNGYVEGAGIGLVIGKQLTELMGGEIGVESVVGRGSTFWLEFDLASGKDSLDYKNQEEV
jgi:signal transduction histidine kinase